jgi:hypothetical protein
MVHGTERCRYRSAIGNLPLRTACELLSDQKIIKSVATLAGDPIVRKRQCVSLLLPDTGYIRSISRILPSCLIGEYKGAWRLGTRHNNRPNPSQSFQVSNRFEGDSATATSFCRKTIFLPWKLIELCWYEYFRSGYSRRVHPLRA